MKVLWLCNVVLTEFCEEFGLPPNPFGGWMSGMLKMLDRVEDIDIAFAFPIIDQWRMKDGVKNGHPYFSFCNKDRDEFELREQRRDQLLRILLKYKPDIVHIWGTEFPWALEMVEVCEEEGVIDRVFVHLQGLVSVYTKHYLSGLPEDCLDVPNDCGRTIRQEQQLFRRKGENEIRILNKIRHVGGRTDWDKACSYAINPNLRYHISREILRNRFYEHCGEWDYNNDSHHSIFISQANYPIKGFHYFLDALPIIVKEFPDTRVYVGGRNLLEKKPPTAYGLYIKKKLETVDTMNNIFFCGLLTEDDMIERFINSSVFVSASSVENSSNSVMEAMMIGTPVISSFVGGLTSFLRHNHNAMLYPESESDMLAYYILKCFSDTKTCEKLSKGGQKTATELTSKAVGIEDLLKIYEELTGQKLNTYYSNKGFSNNEYK